MTRRNFKQDYKTRKPQTANLGFLMKSALKRCRNKANTMYMPSLYLCILLCANAFSRFSPNILRESS